MNSNMFLLIGFSFLISLANQVITIGYLIISGMSKNAIDLSSTVVLITSLSAIFSIFLKSKMQSIISKTDSILPFISLIALTIISFLLKFTDFGSYYFNILLALRLFLGISSLNFITFLISKLPNENRLKITKLNQTLVSFAFFLSILINLLLSDFNCNYVINTVDYFSLLISVLIFSIITIEKKIFFSAELNQTRTTLFSYKIFTENKIQFFILGASFLIFIYIGIFNSTEIPFLLHHFRASPNTISLIYFLTSLSFFLSTLFMNFKSFSPLQTYLVGWISCLLFSFSFYMSENLDVSIFIAVLFGLSNGVMNLSSLSIFQTSNIQSYRSNFIFLSSIISNFGISIGSLISKNYIQINNIRFSMLVITCAVLTLFLIAYVLLKKEVIYVYWIARKSIVNERVYSSIYTRAEEENHV